MPKFTFKTHKSTGRYRTFYPDYIDVKLKGKVVGHIAAKDGSINGPWKVSLAIKHIPSEARPSPFKYARMSADFASVDEAKEALQNNIESIQQNLNLYSFED